MPWLVLALKKLQADLPRDSWAFQIREGTARLASRDCKRHICKIPYGSSDVTEVYRHFRSTEHLECVDDRLETESTRIKNRTAVLQDENLASTGVRKYGNPQSWKFTLEKTRDHPKSNLALYHHPRHCMAQPLENLNLSYRRLIA